MSLNILETIKELSSRRPLFHNEADFQFYFAWLLKEKGYEIRLEHYAGKENNKRTYIDLVAIKEKKCYLFEFKYKTDEITVEINNEKYEFFNHGARDLGSIAVLTDVNRLEKYMGKTIYGAQVIEGFSIFLTNDLKYLNGFKSGSLCYNYGLNDGKVFNSNEIIKFIPAENKTKEDTCVKHISEISFINTHIIKWKDYSPYLKMLIISASGE